MICRVVLGRRAEVWECLIIRELSFVLRGKANPRILDWT